MKNIESFGGIRRSKFVLIFVLVVTLLTMNLSYTVNVEAANNNKPVLKITDVSHQELESNKEYELTVTIANVGNSYGEDGLLSLVVPDETPPIVIKNQLVSENVPYLNPNVDIEVTYTILVESGATEGQYELGMEGTYYDDNNLLYEFQEFFNIDIVEGEEDAILRATVDHSSNVVAGEKNTISVSIDNEGSGGAWALTVLPINTDDIYQVNSDEGYLATLAGGKSIDFDFEVMVDDQASGFTPIEFDVTYLTQNGSVDLTLSSYVNVDTVESGQVIVSNIAKSKSTLYPGGQATFDVTIENVGTNVVEDIKVEVSQDPGLVPSSQSIVIIPEIDSMSSQVVSFSLEATDSASSQNYPVEFTVTYGNETTSQYSGINISNDEDDEEDTVTKPRIVITEFSLSKEKIFLGDEFEMAFNVLNTSTLKDVRNLKVVIDTTTGQTGDSVFLPLNQSNSYFVQELETGGTGEIVMPLKVFANAEGKSYSLNISFEYEDYDGNLYTDSETISIPVYENTELTVSDVRVGSTLDNGYTLEVDFYNTGKVDITNMMVDIEGDFITNNSNYYVGDFTTGRTDVYDVEISGAMPTYLEGTIVFTYDDTFGEEEIYVKDFTIGEVSPNQGERGVSSNSEGEVMAQGTQKDSGTGGQEVQGRGPASNGEMTEAQMEELKGMTREERTALWKPVALRR